MKVRTKDEFEVEVIDNAFDNMEAVDALVEMDEGNPLAISKITSFLFTKEEKKKVYDHLRNEEGRVTLVSFIPFVTEIMTLMGENEKK